MKALTKIAGMIAHDTGATNRFEPDVLEKMVLSLSLTEDLTANEISIAEKFLGTLSDQDLLTLAIGDGEHCDFIYRITALPIDEQMVVEEVLNYLFEAQAVA